MTEHEYLTRLGRALRAADRDEIVEDHRSHFAEARAGGRTEDEIATALGSPEARAAEYGTQRLLDRTEGPLTPGRALALWVEVRRRGWAGPRPSLRLVGGLGLVGAGALVMVGAGFGLDPGVYGSTGPFLLACGGLCAGGLGWLWAVEGLEGTGAAARETLKNRGQDAPGGVYDE